MMKIWCRGGSLLVLVLLLMCLPCRADLTERCSRSSGEPSFTSVAHNPVQPIGSSAGSLEPLYNFAHLFLKAVQPNEFPKGIANRSMNNEDQDISEVLRYEAGYLVCLILAVLYLLLMPLSGAVLLWRHYHGNKDVSARSSLLPSWRYQDIIMATCLAAITILLLTGVILAFTTNNKARQNMQPGLSHLQSSLRDMGGTFQSISQKINVIFDEYSVTKAAIEKEINGTGDIIGQGIVSSFRTDVDKALGDLSVSIQDAGEASRNLQVMDMTGQTLQSRQKPLQSELENLKESLQKTQDMCEDCKLPPLNDLETDADYTKIPNVKRYLDRVSPAASLTNLAEKGNKSFNAIPENCRKQTAPTIKDLMVNLEDTKASLNRSRQQFPSLQSFSDKVFELGNTVGLYERDVDRYDYYRWGVSVAFCIVILIIVLLTAFGLSLGLVAIYCPGMCIISDEGHVERSAASLLKAAVVLSFLSSWLFIILVFITLFFAGNVYTVGCRSWRNGELFEFLSQNDDLFSSLNTSHLNHSSAAQFNISITEVYSGCKVGRSLFHSMHIDQVFDMENFLNGSKYLAKFKQNVRNLSVNLNDMQLLSSKGRQNIFYFRESGIDGIDYSSLMQLLSTPVVKIDLTNLADQLDGEAQRQKNETIKEDLERKANTTRELQKHVELQEVNAKKMDRSVRALSVISANFKDHIDRALSSISMTEEEILRQVPIIVHNVSQCILQKGQQCLHRYLDWAEHAILNEALECSWLAVSLDTMYTALCQNIVDPWNGFWLSLGWCCAFLIPGVICSLYTARYLQSLPNSSSKNALMEDKTTTQKTEQNRKPGSFKKIHDLINKFETIKKNPNEKK